MALISDAGTPLISDPGYKLVREALGGWISGDERSRRVGGARRAHQRRVADRHVSVRGFLPPKGGQRRKRLEELKPVPATLIFYETASRLAATLADMAQVFGAREAAIAKELTKLHESVARGTPAELAAALETSGELKGEFVVLVGPPAAEEAEIGDDAIVARLKQALKQESFRDAVRGVAEDFKVKRSRVYDLGLALERKGSRRTVSEKRVRAYRHGLFAETVAALPPSPQGPPQVSTDVYRVNPVVRRHCQSELGSPSGPFSFSAQRGIVESRDSPLSRSGEAAEDAGQRPAACPEPRE